MISRSIDRVKPVGVTPAVIYEHFHRIANNYRYFRTTDADPIAFIARNLEGLNVIEAADIGCGDGRYDLLLFHHLGDKLRLSCVDPNHGMLETLDSYLREHNVGDFTAVNSSAENLPFSDRTLDCVLTFNAVHHFNLRGFLRESARILKNDGYLIVYTRLREQNKKNIWGLHFPEFHRKETRLYSLNTFLRTVETVPALWIESVQFFKYRRVAALEQLIERARACHYSTFVLYTPSELEAAITGFVNNINRCFKDNRRVKWLDEYALFIIRKDEIPGPLVHT